MTDVLDFLISRVLTRMSVISEQQARSYDRVSVHGGEHDNQVLSLTDKPMIDLYKERYRRAVTYGARRRVVLDALEALRRAKRMTIPVGQPPSLNDPQWKRWVAETDMPVAEIVRRFDVTRQYVHRIRRGYREDA